MSLSELLVVIIVSILLLKPEDLPKILRKLKELKTFINNTKKEIFSYINLDDLPKEVILKENIEEVNFYLEKISSLGGDYTGEYSLEQIKKYHHSLVKKKIKNESKKNKINYIKT